MKVTYDQLGEGRSEDSAIVYVVSDSLGDSANNVVLSAAAQFSDGAVRVVRLSQIKSAEEVSEYFDEHEDDFVSTAVFHSIVDPALRKRVRSDLNNRGILSVDILGPVVQLLAGLTGEKPKNQARAHHMVDKRYLRRVSSMDFFVEHDDGKNPQDLVKADVVLVGLSGSAKTPLAMYLSFLGYNVASVSLDPGCDIPGELAQVDKGRMFGLENSTGVLASASIRVKDAEGLASEEVAHAESAVAHASQVMDELGCTRLFSDEKTVEELSADVISQVERA